MKHFAVLLVLFTALSTPLLATPLFPGQTVVPSTTTAAGIGTLVTSIAGSTTSSMGMGGSTFTADFSESVYVGGSDALCSMCLNFVVQASNSSDNETILSVVLGNFGSSAVSAAFIDAGFPALFVPPSSVSRDPSGNRISFTMDGGLADGQFSDALVVFTNATSFEAGTLSFVSSDAVANATGLAPTVLAPEPSSLMLLGTGVLGLAGAIRRSIGA